MLTHRVGVAAPCGIKLNLTAAQAVVTLLLYHVFWCARQLRRCKPLAGTGVGDFVRLGLLCFTRSVDGISPLFIVRYIVKSRISEGILQSFTLQLLLSSFSTACATRATCAAFML